VANDPTPASAAGAAPKPSDEAIGILTELRGSIDNLDAAIIHLLAERFKCTQKVGALKATHGMPASDPAREARQIERLHRLAVESDLDPVFAERFLNFVIAEVIQHHRALSDAVAPEGGGSSPS
jgi:chorismate mutase